MNEDQIEQSALGVLKELGYDVLHGPDIGPDGTAERQHSDVVLKQRLEQAIARLNPKVTTKARDEALQKIIRVSGQTVLLDNHAFHQLLVNGVNVEQRTKGGEVRTETVRLFDFADPANNECLAVNQLTIIQGDHNRRPDIVLFVNGLPLVVIELKDPTDEQASMRKAFNQIQTYKKEIPGLFRFNELCVLSDGLEATVGTLTSNYERFTAWKTIDGSKEVGKVPMLEVLLRGMCDPKRLLEIIRGFVVFERESERDASYVKKLAAYHQYWAVKKALTSTAKAIQPKADHRAGVVWHTQGSGKSLSMVFFAGRLMLDPEFQNPTVVMVTDRNDLDDQLFETFGNCKELLREDPVQAASRDELQRLLKRASGGIVFTTNAKFFPEGGRGKEFPLLSDRENIIVIADEAHRSQYNFIDGFAKHIRDALPNASFIGFTGTPIETGDRSTPAVFGNYIDVYDIQQAVEDRATVPILYESRLIDLDINDEMRKTIDQEFETLMEGEELGRQEELKNKWSQVEAVIGNKKRLKRIARDIVEHFEKRLDAMDGKGMVVTMSRRIAVELHDEILKLRPQWEGKKDEEGFIKVVMTGSATDLPEWQQHIRNKKRRKRLAEHMKKADTPLKLVIVCDMWLTGFDVPSLHTMYLDKPMKGHNLMQAIARVNRVYAGKPGGLVVDYLGVAAALREALRDYTESGGAGQPTVDQSEALAMFKEKLELVEQFFHGFAYERFFKADTDGQLQTLLDAEEFVLSKKEGEKELRQRVLELEKAFKLANPHPDALALRERVAFFLAVKAWLAKVVDRAGSDVDYGTAIRQIVDKAIAPAGVVDVFRAAGLEKPDVSVLSDEFLAEVRGMDRKNLAVEALEKLLNDEVRTRYATNVVKQRSFVEMLDKALQRYKNKTIEAAQVIEELIKVAKTIRDAEESAEELGLSEGEIAFYDALAENGSARKVMGDDKLRELARVLVERIRKNITVDWTERESAQARLRLEVKKLLREYGYPPDQQKVATDLVLMQATAHASEWVKSA